MNDTHIQQIFRNYIDKFEMINDAEHGEYFKWQVAKEFRPMMDDALNSSNEEFPSKLMKIRAITENLIDGYTQPFYGLIKFAEQSPDAAETVKGMFRGLFNVSNGSIKEKQAAVSEFLKKSHELRDLYFPNSFLYKDDMHSVTTYLFLYDPDHNYIFKASHASRFADCIEFYDDWGSGDSVKLGVYYRMCDQIAAAIKNSPALLKTDASRFENDWGVNPKTFAPDNEKHILVFDLIHCCKAYDLFSGISFNPAPTKGNPPTPGGKETALKLYDELKLAQADLQRLQEALTYIDDVYAVGTHIQHRKYGSGLISAKSETAIDVEFENGETRHLGTAYSAANDIVEVKNGDYAENIGQYKEVLKKEQAIKSAVSYAEKRFAPYAEYLD